MRIALLTYSTRPRGGVVHTCALAEALAARGHEVAVWTLGRGGDTAMFRPLDPRVSLRVVPFPERPDESVGERVLRSIAALRDGFDHDTADVVHAQDCITANAVPRCIRTVHHLDSFTTPELVACHDAAIRTPRAHVCVSKAVAAELAQGYGVTATVIPNGVDAARFAAAAADQRARAAWEQLSPYVLAVGGIEPRKGSIDLLEAMAVVRRTRPELRLVIAGGETLFDYRDYRAQWERRSRQLGLEPVVLGPVAESALPGLVAAARVFAFPSTKEGFGMAALEALAAGVPVVARDLPVLREVLGEAAVLARDVAGLARGIVAAASGPPSRQRAASGRELAVRYTWAAAAQAHERLYERVLAGRP